MELLLERDIRSVNTTIGKLFINSEYQCFVLEDVDRGLKSSMPLAEIQERKLKGDTCIPSGKYPVLLTFSNRFQKIMPLVANVPGFDGIRIHPGNTKEDTAGCLLPGEGRAYDRVINSRTAYDKLNLKIKQAIEAGEKIFITIQ